MARLTPSPLKLSERLELPRRFFHLVAGGSLAFWPQKGLEILAASFISADLLRQKSPLLNRVALRFFKPLMREKERQRLSGASFFLLSATVARAFFPRSGREAIVISAVADPLAGLAGGLKKSKGKSIIGSLSLFAGAWITARTLGLQKPALVAALATLFERYGPFDDNLRLPLALAFSLDVLHLTSDQQNGKKEG